jgi:flagellar motor protein MotB
MASKKSIKKDVNNMVYDIVDESFMAMMMNDKNTANAEKLIDEAAEFQDAMLDKINRAKGKADYNLKLSEQRAQATVQYVISKGIASDRISGKGFGTSELKVACGSQCTEEEHALNRRSEFLIVKK